jgi:hypothetical protein
LTYPETVADDDRRSGEGRTAVASLAAIGSVLAATSCCLPVLPFAMAAGLAGGSAFLSAARPYLLGVAVLCIAFGFYQARRARQCSRKPGIVAPVLLGFSTVFVALSLFFPQVMANAAANLLSRGSGPTPAGQPALVSLTPANLQTVRDGFNAAPNDTRVLIFLSPT